LRIFIDVVKLAVEEIRQCWQLAKNSETKLAKSAYMSLVYMNILFLPVYLIPILYTFVIIGGSLYYGSVLLLGLLFTIPFILFVLWIKVKVYPLMKQNLIKKNKSA
jgi:hypothetical protein